VRRHVIENGRMWVSEFHIDGFRLDAIHAIYDTSPVHVLTEFTEAVRAEASRMGRRVHVIAESHDNDRKSCCPRARRPRARRGVVGRLSPRVHRRLTGESMSYYVDFAPSSTSSARSPRASPTRASRRIFRQAAGTPSADLARRALRDLPAEPRPGRNRPQGERLGTLVPFEAMKLAASLMFVAPAVPLIFMGEEYGETARFQFFSSFLDKNLADAVRQGRPKR
jgi:maltooligosyltrehalose trehalohydrolase